MTAFILANYFGIVAGLGVISVAFHLLFLFLGFEEGWSIWAFFGKASALMNLAIVVPLYAALDDAEVFQNLKGNDAVVFLAIFVITYAAIQSLVPKYVAEKVLLRTKRKHKLLMKELNEEKGQEAKDGA